MERNTRSGVRQYSHSDWYVVEVEVTEVTAAEVICLRHEQEEEYVSFLFDIGDNKALYLSGENILEEADETEPISFVPRDAFDIIRYPNEPNTIVHIDFKGNPLPISRTVTWADFAEIGDLPDGEILTEVTLATIEQDRPDLFESNQGGSAGCAFACLRTDRSYASASNSWTF